MLSLSSTRLCARFKGHGRAILLGAVVLISGASVSLAPSLLSAHMVDPSANPPVPDQKIVVPDSGGVTTVRANNPITTKQQVQIYRGISTSTAGSKQLSMNLIVLPPGMKGLRHRHNGAETVIYILEGDSRTLIGADGKINADNKAGDFIFIPAGVWHQPTNITDKNVIAIEARADADDQTNVEIAPQQ